MAFIHYLDDEIKGDETGRECGRHRNEMHTGVWLGNLNRLLGRP
jgi:hypothetical protein